METPLCERAILGKVHLQAYKIRTWAFARIARTMVFPPHLFISDRRSKFTSNFEHRNYVTAVNVQHSPQKEKERLRRYCFTSYHIRWRRAALPIKYYLGHITACRISNPFASHSCFQVFPQTLWAINIPARILLSMVNPSSAPLRLMLWQGYTYEQLWHGYTFDC